MAGIYIHIPFCKQACHYCDFHFSTSFKYKDELLEAIISEIGLRRSYLAKENIETIYFGGGTPSLLSGAEVSNILDTIGKYFSVDAKAEITLEANPDDLNNVKVKELRRTPVNRLSIGIQSFFNEDLKWMNRAHRAGGAEASVKRAQDAGFENITADLIFDYPLLTDAKWKANIETMLALDIPHISAYSMTVEPKTALASFISKKVYPPLNEQQSADQFFYLSKTLQDNGFEHYEISNYSKPDKYSRHNSNYWSGVKYLGLGPSAHSYNGESRQWNIANNAKYLADISDKKLPAEVEILSETDKLNEYIMTSLRTMWGLDLYHLDSIATGASNTLLKEAHQFLTKDRLTHINNKLFLTPQGKLYADAIAAELFF